MKVAPYFWTPFTKKKKEDRGRWRKGERQEKGTQSKGKRRVKAEQCRKKKKRMRDRETIWGDRGEGLATATLSYIKKMCCSLFSLASLFPLTLSVVLSLPPPPPLSWPFNSLKRYREGGSKRGDRGMEGGREGCFILSSLSLGASRTKTPTLPLCVCVRVCLYVSVCVLPEYQ